MWKMLAALVVLLGVMPIMLIDKGVEFDVMQWTLFAAAAVLILGAAFILLRRRFQDDEEPRSGSAKPID